MRKCLLATIVAVAVATMGAAQTAPKALTNGDVISMFKGGLDSATIISAIQSQDTNFDISATGLLQLKKSAVPPKVIDAMISATREHKKAADAAAAAAAAAAAQQAASAAAEEAAAKAKAAAVVSAPTVPGQPSVLMLQGGRKQPMPIAHTQIVQTKAKVSTLGALASDGSLAQAMAGITQSVAAAGVMKGSSKVASTAMMANPMVSGALMAGHLFASHHKQTVTDVWAISGQRAETVIHALQPAFEVRFDNIPGINPDEYEPVLLKLEPTPSNFRLVGATQAKQEELQATTTDWGMYSSFVEERVPSQASKIDTGSYELKASSAMAPGEYAIALRPLDKEKKFSGIGVSQNTGDGLVFNSVWSFQVQY
ncbi:MAG TPA: hypothetical protein VE398_08465 [Acidobacteriota bacterium]|nr:hypothetical protein [Acidobacteriota bacterium]